jgi:hypothetical protein
VDAILLHESRGDFSYHAVAHEGQQVDVQRDRQTLDIFLAALALGDDLELLDEMLRCRAEGHAFLQLTGPVFSHQAEIPVARDILGA